MCVDRPCTNGIFKWFVHLSSLMANSLYNECFEKSMQEIWWLQGSCLLLVSETETVVLSKKASSLILACVFSFSSAGAGGGFYYIILLIRSACVCGAAAGKEEMWIVFINVDCIYKVPSWY